MVLKVCSQTFPQWVLIYPYTTLNEMIYIRFYDAFQFQALLIRNLDSELCIDETDKLMYLAFDFVKITCKGNYLIIGHAICFYNRFYFRSYLRIR